MQLHLCSSPSIGNELHFFVVIGLDSVTPWPLSSAMTLPLVTGVLNLMVMDATLEKSMPSVS